MTVRIKFLRAQSTAQGLSWRETCVQVENHFQVDVSQTWVEACARHRSAVKPPSPHLDDPMLLLFLTLQFHSFQLINPFYFFKCFFSYHSNSNFLVQTVSFSSLRCFCKAKVSPMTISSLLSTSLPSRNQS